MIFKHVALSAAFLASSVVSFAQDIIAEKLSNDNLVIGYYPYHQKVFFQGFNVSSFNIGITDGTAAGTSYLKAVNNGSVPTEPFFWNDKLCFSIINETFTNELWQSDGTSAGTVKNPVIPDDAEFFKNYNSDVVFTLNYNRELWISDGTSKGTQKIKSFTALQISEITCSATGLFFIARTDISGAFECWYYNKTTNTPILIKSFGGSNSFQTAAVNGDSIYYYLNGTIYKTDSDKSTPIVIRELADLYFTGNIVLEHKSFYSLSDGSVYMYDFATETELVAPGSPIINTYSYRIHNNMLYFLAQHEASNSLYLYQTDLTTHITTSLKLLDSNKQAQPIYIYNDKPVVRGDADNTKYLINALTSDGTPEGTVPFLPKTGIVSYKTDVFFLHETTDYIYFSISGGFNKGMYVIKLSPDNATAVLPKTASFPVSVFPNPFTDRISIQSETAIVSVSAYTVSGVFVTSFPYAEFINTSALPAGSYILKMTSADSSAFTLLIKD
ncbi:MAG: T9SS type A sorting domain-containing protein [Cytophagales bacterium]|nr:T9SS type A sorting domain-containing protein [Cytophaga sp.]